MSAAESNPEGAEGGAGSVGARNPMALAQAAARRRLPRRFYREAAFAGWAGGFALTLDGRKALTPGKAAITVPTARLAEALAAEWNAQGETIDPATMPLTRIVNAAIDGVAARAEAVRAEIVAYAGSDLLCYRAAGPAALAARQEAEWGPLIAWAKAELGARLAIGEGIAHVAQPPAGLANIATALEPFVPLQLAAVHVVTTLTGSAILALALARGRLDAAAAWQHAHIDEDWQIGEWGEDAEAAARGRARWRDMAAAAFILEGTELPGAAPVARFAP